MSKQKSWSYSQLSAYEKCAHAHMYRRIVKLPEPPSWHLTNGNAVHAMAEQYLLGNYDHLPPSLSKFKNEFANLKKHGAKAEEAFVLNIDWDYMGDEDAWLHNQAWLRLKLDARVDNYIVDFKTGKVYDDHINQGRLYADVHMMLNSDVDEVDVEFWYLNSGEIVSHTFNRCDLEPHIKDWNRRVDVMHSDTTFTPTPHEYCKYCYVKEMCNAYK